MPIQSIDAATLKAWLDNGEAVLVDVREPAEHASGRIPTATSVPLGTVSMSTLPMQPDKKLVVHCKAGRRGESACQKLLAEAPELEIYNLAGGIDAWAQSGQPVTGSGANILPLDRQVQLTIGVSLIASVILGHAAHPAFYWIPAFLGAGLTFAGLTGWCGLARLLAMMPWNQKT